ncbi:hypothetical protein L596_001398 [Steinernema carpocapsae]|uniref:Uncharacterized protein n=1 Tax=Steinernema carpocapsae TaxID=34508 RepID=A0A4U8ULF7_STECR|nr:hypothetical protein L596_001398 [Steinernema carpocapsae]
MSTTANILQRQLIEAQVERETKYWEHIFNTLEAKILGREDEYLRDIKSKCSSTTSKSKKKSFKRSESKARCLTPRRFEKFYKDSTLKLFNGSENDCDNGYAMDFAEDQFTTHVPKFSSPVINASDSWNASASDTSADFESSFTLSSVTTPKRSSPAISIDSRASPNSCCVESYSNVSTLERSSTLNKPDLLSPETFRKLKYTLVGSQTERVDDRDKHARPSSRPVQRLEKNSTQNQTRKRKPLRLNYIFAANQFWPRNRPSLPTRNNALHPDSPNRGPWTGIRLPQTAFGSRTSPRNADCQPARPSQEELLRNQILVGSLFSLQNRLRSLSRNEAVSQVPPNLGPLPQSASTESVRIVDSERKLSARSANPGELLNIRFSSEVCSRLGFVYRCHPETDHLHLLPGNGSDHGSHLGMQLASQIDQFRSSFSNFNIRDPRQINPRRNPFPH